MVTLTEFVRDHCVGKQYDSCVRSPCQYASIHGCQHPLHPKNQPQPAPVMSGWDGAILRRQAA